MESRKLSRRQFLDLAGMAAAGGLLAACSQPPATPVPPTAEPAAQATEPAPPAATPVPEPPARIQYHYLTWGVVTDAPLVAEAMSKISAEKIGATIDLKPMDWGQWDQKLPLMFAAGDEMDLMFTCHWTNAYGTIVRDGVLTDLTEMLPSLAPGLWASLKPDYWRAAYVEGRLYAGINQQILCNYDGIQVRKDVAEQVGFDVKQVKTYKDLRPFAEAVKQKMPDIYPSATNFGSPFWRWNCEGYEGIGGGCDLKYDGSLTEPIYAMEAPEVGPAAQETYEWVRNGFMPNQLLPTEDLLAQIRGGKVATLGIGVLKPGVEGESKARYGYDWVAVPLMNVPPYATTANVIGSLTGLSRTTKSAEKAVRMLEMMNTDVEFYNLLCKGIENVHWVWKDKARKLIGFPEGVDAKSSTYNPTTDWMYGNQFLAYYVDEAQAAEDVWEKTRQLNERAVVSKYLGFEFDSTPVEADVPNVGGGVPMQDDEILAGVIDTEPALSEVRQGFQCESGKKVRAEVKKQVEEWLAANA